MTNNSKPRFQRRKRDPMYTNSKDNRYLLRMAEVIGKLKPLWKAHNFQLTSWGKELVRLHDLWEEEQKRNEENQGESKQD
jgi:hypothetical protein